MAGTRSRNPRACIFCRHRLTAVRSQEHVFPRWLLDELDIKTKQVSAVHWFRAEAPDCEPKLLSIRSLAFGNIREGRICAACNNGWMSDLEHSCQQILLDMIHGRRRPAALSDKECLPVARWAAKTAYMLNSSTNYPTKVPSGQLSDLYNSHSRLPWGVAAIATTSDSFGFTWYQSTRWQLCAPDRLTSRIAGLMDTRTYKIGVQFGHLILIVVWHAIPGWWKMLWNDQHIVLWPLRGKCGWHFDDCSILRTLQPEQLLPLHVNEIKLVHPRYLMKP